MMCTDKLANVIKKHSRMPRGAHGFRHAQDRPPAKDMEEQRERWLYKTKRARDGEREREREMKIK